MSASFISLLFTETKKIKFFTKENGFVALRSACGLPTSNVIGCVLLQSGLCRSRVQSDLDIFGRGIVARGFSYPSVSIRSK